MDERKEWVAGKISGIVLGITQVALGLSVLYRAYFLNQTTNEFGDIVVIMLLSIGANIFASLYYGGFYPVLKIRTLVYIYLGLVLTIAGVATAKHGPPDLSEWYNNILPALLGPALILGLYHWVAKMGEKRLNQHLED
jgi:hypothetical protein